MWHRMHFLDLQQLDRWPNGCIHHRELNAAPCTQYPQYMHTFIQISRVADYHMEMLTIHYRVSANPLARFKVCYSCADRSDVLKRTFGLVASKNSPDVEPASFCHGCYNVLVWGQKASEANRLYTHCCLHGVHTQNMPVLCVITFRRHQGVDAQENWR